MKVKRLHPRLPGYTKIFTHLNPAPSNIAPEKKPYIVFIAPENYYPQRNSDEGLLIKYGLVETINKQRIITITSARKVKEVIRLFMNLPEYNLKENEELLQALQDYAKHCEAIQSKKQTAPPPPKSKNNYESYTRISEMVSTNYATEELKKSKAEYDKFVYFKRNPTSRSISEIEAYNALCYRMYIRHSKVKSGVDQNGKRTGLFSTKLEGFISVYDYVTTQNNNIPLKKKLLLDAEFAKILAASYAEKEYDLHPKNYGLMPVVVNGVRKLCFVKIDDDQTAWPLTSKYNSKDPRKLIFDHLKTPEASFPVSAIDLDYFPMLNDAMPNHWCTYANQEKIFDQRDLFSLYYDDEFIKQKYFTWLKRILIPNDAYVSAAQATLRSTNKQQKFSQEKCNRTEELKSELLGLQSFQDYVVNNPHVIDEICAEFTEFNREEQKYMQINIEEVRNNFTRIKNEVKQRKNDDLRSTERILTGVLLGLGIFIATAIVVGALVATSVIPIVPIMTIIGGVGLAVKIIGLSAIFASCAAALATAGAIVGKIVDKVYRRKIDDVRYDPVPVQRQIEQQEQLPEYVKRLSLQQDSIQQEERPSVSDSVSNRITYY